MKKTIALFSGLLILTTAGAHARDAAKNKPTQAAEAADVETAPELGWPREYSVDDWRMVVYQPQLQNWQDFLRIEAYAAVLMTPPGAAEPVAGAIKLRAGTDTHMDSRTVFVHDVELVEIRIPEIEGTPKAKVEEIVRSVFPDKPVAYSLDRILAAIASSETRGRKVELDDRPPTIFVSERPAVLVNIDGEPAWVPSGVDDLAYAANTNWDLFKFDGKKKFDRYYLRNNTNWLGADELSGPWGPAGKLPKAFTKLPLDDNFRSARINVPGKKLEPGAAPTVFVSTTPAELILIDGEPKPVPIPDTPLLFVDNTEADLFRHIDDGHWYYLVAGRWFRNDDLDGEWSAATGNLPDDFADIPDDHGKAHVLASVPGTAEAEEAALQAQIPTVAEVSRGDAPKEVKVEYSGDPEFREIEGTQMAYAVNTASDVIRLGDAYYLCASGVWFASKTPTGPWTVADEVPKEIYSIPPSSPMHHTTYVYVYDSTPDTVVYGYTPGYVGLYVAWGCAVWGTGWYYPPYYYYDPFYYPYPIYYPYAYTYGAGAWYNPATGFYGRGYAYYGPYGGVGRAAAYNPRTGTYARGGYAYGVGGGTSWGRAYNPRTGTSAAGYRSANAYSSWGRGVVSRGDNWIQSGYYSDARGTVRGFRGSEGGALTVDRGDSRGTVARRGDDLYVGNDGNVYRRGEDGWYQYGGRDEGWTRAGDHATPEQRAAARERAGQDLSDSQRQAARDRAGARSGSAGTLGDLDRSAAARQRGNARSSGYDNWRSSGGWSSGASGRSMSRGGMSRGGMRGGRR